MRSFTPKAAKKPTTGARNRFNFDLLSDKLVFERCNPSVAASEILPLLAVSASFITELMAAVLYL